MGTTWTWFVLGLRAGCMDRSSGDGRGPRAASVPAAERRMGALGILDERVVFLLSSFWGMGETLRGLSHL